MSLSMKRNLIGHCTVGNSDKVYVASVRTQFDVNGVRSFSVVGKWAARGRAPTEQTKLTTSNEAAAFSEQRRLFQDKCIKSKYVDIESPAYSGPLRRNSPQLNGWLEPETTIAPPPPATPPQKPAPKPAPKPRVQEKDFEVRCLDNNGIEDKFDKEVDYVAEPHADTTLLWVYDNLGAKQECFASRFLRVSS